MTDSSKISCQECGVETHSVQGHLKKAHPELSIRDYIAKYQGSPIMSAYAKEQIEIKKKERQAGKVSIDMATTSAAETAAVATGTGSSVVVPIASGKSTLKPMSDLFGTELVNGRGNPINVTVLTEHEYQSYVEPVDETYIWDTERAKDIGMALEENIPAMFWGHAGTGKSTLVEQACALTNRPLIRVQHTANTEESHIVGQTLANEKGTYFEPGVLALAMRNGWVYLADEYDFAFPQVLGVYQPILEGKALIIKEAPPEWRRVEPHKNFRFVATGNTNGAGDETGLYQGTNVQNAANYSRFGICEKVDYMDEELEVKLLSQKAQALEEDVKLVVKFARDIRRSYDSGDINSTIGHREMLYACKVGILRGNYAEGIKKAFISKLPESSTELANQLLQRSFG